MTQTSTAKATETKSGSETLEKTSPIREVEYGTHKVFLRRRPLGGHLPKEVQAEATTKLSSIFVNRQPLKGFEDTEDEKKYLNGLLDVGPDDRDWSKYVRKFWAELRISVGFTGVELEVGTDQSGWPLNIMDFVTYNFAKRHLLVAISEEEMMRNPTKRFYIMDPKKETSKKNINVQVSKQADREFIKATEDVERMKNLLQVLSNVKTENYDAESIENMLFDIKQNQPKKFLAAALDKDLDMRAEISSFVSSGVLLKVGPSYVHGNDTLANSEEETITFFKNAKNSGLLNILRTKHREMIR
jgi:hypothetical protein